MFNPPSHHHHQVWYVYYLHKIIISTSQTWVAFDPSSEQFIQITVLVTRNTSNCIFQILMRKYLSLFIPDQIKYLFGILTVRTEGATSVTDPLEATLTANGCKLFMDIFHKSYIFLAIGRWIWPVRNEHIQISTTWKWTIKVFLGLETLNHSIFICPYFMQPLSIFFFLSIFNHKVPCFIHSLQWLYWKMFRSCRGWSIVSRASKQKKRWKISAGRYPLKSK